MITKNEWLELASSLYDRALLLSKPRASAVIGVILAGNLPCGHEATDLLRVGALSWPEKGVAK